jgi:hypothetical protein
MALPLSLLAELLATGTHQRLDDTAVTAMAGRPLGKTGGALGLPICGGYRQEDLLFLTV